MGPAKGMVGSAALWGGGRVKLGPYPPQEGGAPGPDWMLRGLEGSTVHKPGPTDTHSGPDSATSSLEGVTLPYLPIHTLVLSHTPHILFINTSHYPPHTHTLGTMTPGDCGLGMGLCPLALCHWEGPGLGNAGSMFGQKRAPLPCSPWHLDPSDPGLGSEEWAVLLGTLEWGAKRPQF